MIKNSLFLYHIYHRTVFFYLFIVSQTTQMSSENLNENFFVSLRREQKAELDIKSLLHVLINSRATFIIQSIFNAISVVTWENICREKKKKKLFETFLSCCRNVRWRFYLSRNAGMTVFLSRQGFFFHRHGEHKP